MLEEDVQGDKQPYRGSSKYEAVPRVGCIAHPKRAKWSGDALNRWPGQNQHPLTQYQSYRPGGRHGVKQATIQPPDDQNFHAGAKDGHSNSGQQHRHGQGYPGSCRPSRDIGSEHHELAVRQIDDAHHPEDDGEPDRGEDEKGDAHLVLVKAIENRAEHVIPLVQ